MSHETKIVHGKPLGDSKRWIAQCSCGRRSDSWLDCDDARANLADMHPPSVLPSDPRDDEIAALRARVETAEKDRNDAWKREQTLIDELHDAGGALDDAGVRRHEDDEIASGIEKLAKDRDELLDQWFKVGNLFWPHREPDDGWSADEVADEVKALRARVAALEAVVLAARSEIAYMDETKAAHPDALVEPTLNELRAALAAVEVQK